MRPSSGAVCASKGRRFQMYHGLAFNPPPYLPSSLHSVQYNQLDDSAKAALRQAARPGLELRL